MKEFAAGGKKDEVRDTAERLLVRAFNATEFDAELPDLDVFMKFTFFCDRHRRYVTPEECAECWVQFKTTREAIEKGIFSRQKCIEVHKRDTNKLDLYAFVINKYFDTAGRILDRQALRKMEEDNVNSFERIKTEIREYNNTF